MKKYIGILAKITGFILIVILAVNIILPLIKRNPDAAYEKELEQTTFTEETMKDVGGNQAGKKNAERIRCIDDNEEALLWRLRMIGNAKKSIVLSTFDLRPDDSGTKIIAALYTAAERGVQVQILIDGIYQKLFLEKGYENTTIQDIVDELGGLTKGAVYHHFKSKEEIMDAVGDRMFFSNNPFEAVRSRTDLNGLQKLREVVRLNQSNEERVRLTAQSVPIAKSPRLLQEMIVSNRKVLTPYFLELIEEGNRDGSMHTDYPREIAELLPLLTSLWLLPSLFPASREQMKNKFAFLGEMLEKMGVPLMDDGIRTLVDRFFEQIPEEQPEGK